MSKKQTYHEHDSVCPLCGYIDLDSWEITEDGDSWCGSCEKPIHIEVCVEVTYTTTEIKE